MVVAASSSSPRYTSDLEQARPQTSGEEELQLQLALAMSREEAEKVRPRNPTVVGRGWARGRMPGSPSALTQALSPEAPLLCPRTAQDPLSLSVCRRQGLPPRLQSSPPGLERVASVQLGAPDVSRGACYHLMVEGVSELRHC